MGRMIDAERAWAEERVPELVGRLLRDESVLEIASRRGPDGALVVDCGVVARGSWEAGRRLAMISHAGMMRATLGMCEVAGAAVPELVCDSWRPALSTYGLQVSFALSEVDPGIRVSGPVRAAIDGWEGISTSRGLRDGQTFPWGVAMVEAERLPDGDVVSAIAQRARLRTEDLTLLVVPGNSLAGVAQIAGRLNECVLFTLAQSLGLDPECVVGMLGAVPLAPCGADVHVMQDDMIHYAGRVAMTVDAPPSWNLQAVADALVFASSPAHGRLFAELLAEAGGVFEAIPGLTDLNKVAQLTVTDRRSGRTASAGTLDAAILARAAARAKGSRDESC